MAVHDGLGAPWCWLIEAQLMALVALGFFVAAQRFQDKRFSWLLSSSVAAGFAIAAFYNFAAGTGARAIPAAGLSIMFMVLMLFVMHTAAHACRSARGTAGPVSAPEDPPCTRSPSPPRR